MYSGLLLGFFFGGRLLLQMLMSDLPDLLELSDERSILLWLLLISPPPPPAVAVAVAVAVAAAAAVAIGIGIGIDATPDVPA